MWLKVLLALTLIAGLQWVAYREPPLIDATAASSYLGQEVRMEGVLGPSAECGVARSFTAGGTIFPVYGLREEGPGELRAVVRADGSGLEATGWTPLR